ncbi:MAG: crotonobetainyl-CoA--carnitine CoA-transferase [Actinobacteria bacterium]|nr:crotonobetainyl-CoA--carnitine CoA-transferase [Actinomycetota bacterium]
MRSSTVAKLLYVNELYELIVRQPGVILELGVWWGANLALFESLRAVHEPYNYTRRIAGFDTFEGYPSIAAEDGADELASVGQYAVGGDYLDHLGAVLEYHRFENPMSHLERFEVVAGDAAETVADYLARRPETIVALAYFDMQLYEPTKRCLEAIRPHLTRGSVIAMDELNAAEFPGETVAFREVFELDRYWLQRSRFLPDRTYLVVD